jgi:hypothetical protein
MCAPEGAARHRKSSGGRHQAGFLVVMSYETVVAIVVCNAAATLLIFLGMLGMGFTKANRPVRLPRKATKLLWRSDPIVPKHDPPEGPEHDADRVFFEDFKDFAHVINWHLSDKYVGSGFRLEDLPSPHVQVVVFVGSNRERVFPPGRCFKLYYNQYPVGRLQIHPAHGYTTKKSVVYAEVVIDRARNLRYGELMKFLGVIADFVAGRNPESDGHIESRRSIETALVETLWGNYENDQGRGSFDAWEGDDKGLVVRFKGRAEWYMHHMLSRREQGQAAPSRRPLNWP